MKTVLQKWGNSLALRIPKTVATEIDVGAGQAVDVQVSRGRILVAPVTTKRYELSDLISEMTAKNRRAEIASARYVPDRGDVVWLEFDPQAGHEQAGHRPAVVLSPRVYNQKSGLALFCPITTRIKGYPFEVVLPQGLARHGVVLCDQVKSLDWNARRSRLAGRLAEASLDDILAKIRVLLR